MATIRKKVTVTTTTEVVIEFDPGSEKFVKLLSDFRQCMNSNAMPADILEHVAYHVEQKREDGFIEGVGFVKHKGAYSLEAEMYAERHPKENMDELKSELNILSMSSDSEYETEDAS